MSQASDSTVLNYEPQVVKPALALDKRLRLSVMMFLQFAVWGAWFIVFGVYCGDTLHFGNAQIGSLYGTIALGAIVSMMFAGQIADRLMPAQYLMAVCHLGGAALLIAMANIHGYDAGRFAGPALIDHDFTRLWWIALSYALLYNPTLSLANTVAFAHIPDSARDFPTLRVLGTIGWIVAASSPDWLHALKLVPEGLAATNKPLLIAAGLSAALGLFAFVLPNTPPGDKRPGGIPFLRALKLLTDPSFGVFFWITLAITIALGFYYTFLGNFLHSLQFKNVGAVSTIGQYSELCFMLLLPLALKKLGMKWVLGVGMAAWALRYALFAIPGHPHAAVITGVALHGVCFDFFLAAGFIYTDEKAPEAIRGSAQALFGFIVYGVGMWLGNFISGQVAEHFTHNGVSDWSRIWAIPSAGAFVCLLVFLILWRDRPNPQHIQD
jgi:nucleoside transporter